MTRVIGRYQQIKELIDITPTVNEVDEMSRTFVRDRDRLESKIKEIVDQLELVKKNMSQKVMEIENSFRELEKNHSTNAEQLWSEIEATKDDLLNGYQNVSGKCATFLGSYKKELDGLKDFITQEETIADGIEVYMGKMEDVILKMDNSTAKDWLPESFTYLKMYKEKEPNEIWPHTEWEDVTKNYSDCFLFLDQSNYGEVKPPSFTGEMLRKIFESNYYLRNKLRLLSVRKMLSTSRRREKLVIRSSQSNSMEMKEI